MPDRARILIVDDSRIFRAALEEALAGQEGIAVVGSVYSGEKALEFIRVTPPDLVTLDVEMPGLDGLQTLEAIQRVNATRPPGSEVGVVMVSAFTRHGANVTMRALQAGAFDFVTKPSGPCAEECLATLRQQLVCRIRLFMGGRRAQPAGSVVALETVPVNKASRARWLHAQLGRPVRAVVIASSTGGPRALDVLLPSLCGRIEQPVFIVQHMPAPFTQSLADHLSHQCGCRVVEGRDGEAVGARTVYLAPGGKHLVLRTAAGHLVTGLNEQPAENRCRPAADVLFRSVAAQLAGDVVAVVLTGMDCDGTAGLAPLKRAGGYVIAQDEATSVVWGMPGNVVRAGLADEVLPLGQIAAAVQELVSGRGAN